ncbi:ProQ/FINO family protein [Billgrantia sp. LNSP4103-1]|uniref:ProQ/FINO family protein n=1 Tax=Billgrantia sp. LNSP4103-1 TaxID=3410266 RepID=UPI00403FA489
MIEERSLLLFSDLEARAADALEELRVCRAKVQELETRLAESDALRQELEAARLELAEENRELDEQNRELEEDNSRLRERLRKGEPAPVFPGTARRAQGLAALIGQRPREEPAPGNQRGAVEDAGPEQTQDEAEAACDEAMPSRSPAAATSDEAPATPEPSRQSGAGRERGEGKEDDRQGALAIEQAPSADALLKQWYQRYPRTFFKGHTRPLKVGIHHDLTVREPWPEKLVRRALAGYVNLPRYLKAVREGAERIDLDGAPAGSVDAQAAEHAKRKLERLQSERRERGLAAGGAARRDGSKTRGSRRSESDRHAPKAERSSRAASAGSKPTPAETAKVPADPEARMEAKLSALLAKHGQAKGH